MAGLIPLKAGHPLIPFFPPGKKSDREKEGRPKSPLSRGVADPLRILLGKAGVCKYQAIRAPKEFLRNKS